MCAVICRKATLRFPKPISSLPGANPYPFEHKIGIFVRFWGLEPPFSGVSSTKSGFLCFFGLRDPRFRAFRAQNRGFCALLGSGTPVFRVFEHKIGIFVRFWGLEPSFSGFSSTKSAFLCSRGGECGIVKRNRGEAYHFAAAPTPSHQRTSTSAPTPAHQHHQRPPSNGTRRRQVLSWHHVVLSMRRQVPSGAV